MLLGVLVDVLCDVDGGGCARCRIDDLKRRQLAQTDGATRRDVVFVDFVCVPCPTRWPVRTTRVVVAFRICPAGHWTMYIRIT